MKIKEFMGEYLCICGNTEDEAGFYPCTDIDGQIWTENCVVCAQCGRVINQLTLEVVGTREW